MRFVDTLFLDGANAIEATSNLRSRRGRPGVIASTDDTDKREYLYTLLGPSDANLLFRASTQPDIKRCSSWARSPLERTALSNAKSRLS